MEKIQKTENSVEITNIGNTPENVPVTLDSIEHEIQEINLGIQKQEESIETTVSKVREIRNELNLPGEETNIPSIVFNIHKKDALERKKKELENKLSELLKSDISEKYQATINQVRQSKINWSQSEELARRLKLKGATDEDVMQVKNWLIDNATNAKTFILSPNKFQEVIEVLHEMTGEENINKGSAFHIPGGRTDIPDFIKSSIFIKEKPSAPALPGQESQPANTININELHHEFGHATEDGLLDSNLYEDWNPVFKETAPDKEYVGLINETDTRITSMYRDLGESFDPQKEVFGKKHLEILRSKLATGQINKDTRDLFDHYDDITIMKMANRMPAI